MSKNRPTDFLTLKTFLFEDNFHKMIPEPLECIRHSKIQIKNHLVKAKFREKKHSQCLTHIYPSTACDTQNSLRAPFSCKTTTSKKRLASSIDSLAKRKYSINSDVTDTTRNHFKYRPAKCDTTFFFPLTRFPNSRCVVESTSKNAKPFTTRTWTEKSKWFCERTERKRIQVVVNFIYYWVDWCSVQ